MPSTYTRKFTPKKRKRRGSRAVYLVFLFLLGIFVAKAVSSHFNPLSLLKPISVFSQIINPSGLEKTDGQTNALILGLDRRTEGQYTGILTDTIIVGSYDHKTKEAVMISLPRDLWVPYDSGSAGKINAAYAYGGIDLAKTMVEKALGVPIHYYAVIDFEGFRKAIDILGGVDVEVEQAFDDYKYPIPGREDVWPENDRYEYLHFDAGRQHMDGELALKFARSRMAVGPEGNDFARAKRQQKVVLAAKDRLLSLNLLKDSGKIKDLYYAFKDSVETNGGLLEIERAAALGNEIEKTQSVVINGGGENGPELLVGIMMGEQDEQGEGGVYALVPKAGDFSEIHEYVQRLLFGEQ